MNTRDYKSDTCTVDYLSDFTPAEAEEVIGKTVVKIHSREYGFEIIFTDDSTLEINGHSYQGGSLEAFYS